MSAEHAYRVLFPIGWLNGVLGAALWIAFKAGLISFYPSELHANLMIGGFLFSYALGFLWTAVPRFLQAPAPSRAELALLVTVMGATPVLGMLREPVFFQAAMLAGLGLTARFGRKRFRLRRGDPPPSFLFLVAGVLAALISLAVQIAGRWLALPWPIPGVARALFLKGFLLCMVLGVGIKLIPALLGWQPVPASREGQSRLRADPLTAPILLLLFGGLALEAVGSVRLAGLACCAALTAAGLFRMRLGEIPPARSALSISIWISCLAVCFSPLTLTINPAFAVHFWHLVFISGMGLMTMFVSTRVVLAHSGQEFLRWEKSPALYAMAALVLLAAITRVIAPLLAPAALFSHYAYAAVTWILALCIWAWYFARFTPFRL